MPNAPGQGRKPKPTSLKVIAGNPGKRKLNEDEPKPAADSGLNPPKRLRGQARAEWKRIAPILSRVGLLTEIDRNALALYCDTYAAYLHEHEELSKESSVQLFDRGPRANPRIHTINKYRETMHKFLTEFGMTPSSRTRVRVTPQQGAAKDEWSSFDE